MRAATHVTRVLFGLAMAAITPVTSPAQVTAITGGTVIDGTGRDAIAGGVVLVAGGRITCVGTPAQCAVPANATRVDATGRFITPGLVDVHVHFSQTGWLDGRPDGAPLPSLYPYPETARRLRDNPGTFLRALLCSGVTAVFDVGGHPWTTTLGARTERDPMAPHVRAAGPLVTHASRPALQVDDEIYTFLPMSTPADVRASVAKLKAMGASAVKVWYLAPRAERREELDARMMDVGAAATAAGLDLIVHATSLREAKVALRAGAVLLVHSVEDELVDDEFLQLLAANQAVYSPTLIVGRNWTRAFASSALAAPLPIDDPNRCVDSATVARLHNLVPVQAAIPEAGRSPDRVFSALENAGVSRFPMAENLRRVHRAGAPVVVATDAGNPLTLHGPSIYNEMEAMQAAGIAPADIIVMATRNGARALRRERDLGTLAQGRIADLVVLAEDPRANARAFRSVTHVMRGGRLHRIQDLAQRAGSASP